MVSTACQTHSVNDSLNMILLEVPFGPEILAVHFIVGYPSYSEYKKGATDLFKPSALLGELLSIPVPLVRHSPGNLQRRLANTNANTASATARPLHQLSQRQLRRSYWPPILESKTSHNSRLSHFSSFSQVHQAPNIFVRHLHRKPSAVMHDQAASLHGLLLAALSRSTWIAKS